MNLIPYISQIIHQLITDIKTKEHKQIILVIEDMDRIDPAHIFRILNVFSAHWDIQDYSEQKLTYGNPQNKYNFDKILLVCHFQNIKNIFHHFYGERTDFTGYIHKFSSSTPYEYSLREVVEEWLLDKMPFNKDKFSEICRALVTLIMRKYENSEMIITNLRHMTSFLVHFDGCNIKDAMIPPIDDQNRINYCISTSNQVTQLLCILKRFQITIDEFISYNALTNNFHMQLCEFIGHCWLIFPICIPEYNSECCFNFTVFDNQSINCTIKQYSFSLQCVAQKIPTIFPCKYYSVKYMSIMYLYAIPQFQKWFSWENCKTILNVFMKYIY